MKKKMKRVMMKFSTDALSRCSIIEKGFIFIELYSHLSYYSLCFFTDYTLFAKPLLFFCSLCSIEEDNASL